jgi:hypothetical protein
VTASRHVLAACLALSGLAGSAISFAATPDSISNVPDGKSQIVFYRLSTMVGAVYGCSVFEKGTKILELGRGRYQVADFEPGRHTFTNRSGGIDVFLEPNERRFVMCKVTGGGLTFTPQLSITDEAAFMKRFPKLKPQAQTESGTVQ